MADMYQPSIGSLSAEPMTTTEIDAHPDADRIWATIGLIQGRQEEDKEQDEFERQEEQQEEVREAYIEGQYKKIEELSRSILDAQFYFDTDEEGNVQSIRHYMVLDDMELPIAEALEKALDELVDSMEEAA